MHIDAINAAHQIKILAFKVGSLKGSANLDKSLRTTYVNKTDIVNIRIRLIISRVTKQRTASNEKATEGIQLFLFILVITVDKG